MIGEDFEFVYKYLLKIQKVKVDTTEILYNYLLRNGSAMKINFNTAWFKEIDVCEEIINSCEDKKTKKCAIRRLIRSDLMCASKILKDTYLRNLDKNEEYLNICKEKIKKYGINSYYKASIKDKVKIFLIANCTPLIKMIYHIDTKIKSGFRRNIKEVWRYESAKK